MYMQTYADTMPKRRSVHEICTFTNAERKQEQLDVFIHLYSLSPDQTFIGVSTK